MRLIDADEIFYDQLIYAGNKEHPLVYAVSKVRIDDMPTIEPQQWIPVTERLPNDYDFVLITMRRMNERYNHIPFISVGYIGWNQTAWWCAHDGDCESAEVEVLAWMPLPEPFRGGESDGT